MDLNDLFSRHQHALVGAAMPGSGEARSSQRALADHLAARIRAFQHSVGAGFAGVEAPR